MKPLKVAIIGAGFAGLSLAWHLLSFKVQCTVFDKKGIGQGASGVASGLLHPFPAAASNYSFMGKEALHDSMKLLQEAQKYSREKIADFSGILKLALEDEQKKNYGLLTRRYEGLKWLEVEQVKKEIPCAKSSPALLIENGITVFCKRYLEALWHSCQEKGGDFKIEEIQDLADLEEYPIKVLCCGSSIKTFDPTIPLQLVKGQVLVCRAPYPLSLHSVVAKGYIAITEDPLIYHIGSSYEHHFKEEGPWMEKAKELIFEQLSYYTGIVNELEVLGCRSGVRVMYPKTHLPIIKKYPKGIYAMTAFGSRGLLYHGLLARQLTEMILFGDQTRISREFFLS